MKKRSSKKTKKAPEKRTAVAIALEEQQVLRSELEQGPEVPMPLEEPLPSGPRKGTLLGTPPPRLSNHKTRGRWFQARAAWPVREAPVHNLVRERARSKKVLAAHSTVTAEWENVGPSNIGGRTTCIVCHPTMAERIWIGAAGGGVWYSEDAGQNWHPLWRSQDILNIGSLAIDASNPDVLFCGTGEANLSADSYAGVGLYQTTDAGKSWRLIADSKKTGIPSRIGVIAIDPFDSNHIVIGGVGYAEVSSSGSEFGGMYVSFDAGISWKRETFISDQNYWCHSIVFHPAKRGILFATFTEQGTRSGIWKSVDGGQVWTQLSGGLPDAARIGRTSLAISRSNPDVLYAFAQDVLSGNRDRLLGVFRTSNGGKTWKDIAGTHFKKERQISYNNTIAVHPTKPNHVICAGVDLHLTTDGGATWKQVTRWDAVRGKSNYAHADHHALLIPTSAPNRVYDANDGGLDVSEDGGVRWVNRSNGLTVTMFYDMDVAQTDGRTYGGGAQDNGTLGTITGRSDDFIELTGGDGGWMVIDPNDARHIYSSSQFMGIYRFRPSTEWEDVSPPATEEEQGNVWMVFIAMDPVNSNTVYTGSTRVWRTRNDGAKWSAISPDLDGSPITAIEIAPANNKRIYIGTENGSFFRSLDGGQKWSPNISSATLPKFAITRLESSPKNADIVFATVANFGHSHVFRSKDGGSTWEDVDKGQLPNVPHYAVLIQPDAPETVYVCNDVGVFVSTDLGATWMSLTKNLPNVMVVDLAYHVADRTLSAATYGRSIWRIRIS